MHHNQLNFDMSAIKINSILYYLQFLAVAAVNVICSPLLLASLGDSLFGAWKVINRFLDLATIFDGRPGATLKINLSSAIGKNAAAVELQQIVGSAIHVVWRALFLLVPMVFAVAFFSPYLAAGLPNYYYADVRILSFILIAALFFSTAYSVYDAILFSEMKSYVSSIVQIFSSVLLGIGLYVATQKESSLLYVGVATLVSAAFAFIACRKFVKNYITWYGIISPSKELLVKFASSSKSSVFWAMIEKIVLSIDIFLIGFYCSAAEVAEYTFSSYIYQLALTIALVGTSAYMPELMRNYSSGSIVSAVNIISIIKKKLFFVSGLFSGVIFFLNDYFVKFWAGTNVEVEGGVSIALALMLLQLSYLRCQGQIMDALNLINEKSIYFLFSIVFSVVLVVFLDLFFAGKNTLYILVCIFIARLPVVFIFNSKINKRLSVVFVKNNQS